MFGDPFNMSSKVVEQMEALFIERMKEMLGNPALLSQVSKSVESGLESKKEFDSALKKQMESLNIPTRDDIAKVLIYLQRIESKVADLEESVEDLSDELKALKKESPPRPVRKAALEEPPTCDTNEAEKGRGVRASAGRGKPKKSSHYGKERGTGAPHRGERGTGAPHRGERSTGTPYRGEKGTGAPRRGERSAPKKTGGRKKR